MRTRALTLVEVLVAITIILVLAGLVFTAGSQSLSKAKETVCISNLRQIYAAMAMYESDFGDYPPMNDEWQGLLPYYGGEPFDCPLKDIAQPNDTERLRVDYFVHAFFRPPFEGTDEDKECMDMRGPSYPIAHDGNHAAVYVSYRSGRSVYLVLRLDGSVHIVQRASMDRFPAFSGDFPCPSASWWSNL